MAPVDIEFWQKQIQTHKEENHKSCPQGLSCSNAECELSHGAEHSSWLPLNVCYLVIMYVMPYSGILWHIRL